LALAAAAQHGANMPGWRNSASGGGTGIQVPAATQFKLLAGRGVQASVDGREIFRSWQPAVDRIELWRLRSENFAHGASKLEAQGMTVCGSR